MANNRYTLELLRGFLSVLFAACSPKWKTICNPLKTNVTVGEVKDSKRVNYGKVIAEVRTENIFRGGAGFGGWGGGCGVKEYRSVIRVRRLCLIVLLKGSAR